MPVLKIIIAGPQKRQTGVPVAEWFGARAREHAGFDVHFVDLAETRLDGTAVNAADAFVFVIPADGGVDAASKIVTDGVDFGWQYKPFGVISHGSRAGDTAGVQAITEVLALLGMTRIDQSITMDVLDQGTEAVEAAAAAMLDELWCLDPFLSALRMWASTTQPV